MRPLGPEFSYARIVSTSELGTSGPVIVKVRIERDKAYLDDDVDHPYDVMKDTDDGVVFAQSYAEPSHYGQGNMVGLFGIRNQQSDANNDSWGHDGELCHRRSAWTLCQSDPLTAD